MNRSSALREVVQVLNADNVGDRLRLGQLPRRDGAQTDTLNEALLFQFGERGLGLLKGLVFRHGESPEPEIDDLERIEPQVAQIVVDRVDDLLAGPRVAPGTIGSPARTDFRHDDQIIGIRVQRLLNDLIGDMGTVEIAGIDMVHARGHRFAQNRDGAGNVARRTPHPLVASLSGELHRAVTHAIDGE
jgi:hypothetical protein